LSVVLSNLDLNTKNTTTEVDTASGTDEAVADMKVDCPTDVMVVKAVLVGDPTQAIQVGSLWVNGWRR
jgi:hypothetical protein